MSQPCPQLISINYVTNYHKQCVRCASINSNTTYFPASIDNAFTVPDAVSVPVALNFSFPVSVITCSTLVAIYEACPAISSHFEYLENRSHDLDLNWQPVRGDLTAHP